MAAAGGAGGRDRDTEKHMRAFLAMVKANLKMVVRNRQALFWNLAFPALFIIIFGTVFDPDGDISITVGVAGETSDFQTATIDAMKSSDAFDVKTGTVENELKKLDDGDRSVVLVFGAPPAGSTDPAITLYYDNTSGPTADLATSSVRQVLFAVAQGEDPVQITDQPVSSDDISYIDFLVPGIVGMALMNSGIIGLSTAFVTYRERGILRRIKVTPFPLTSFILARVVSQLVVAVAQAVILIGLAMLLFDLDLQGNPLLILLMVIAGALAFLSIGFAISGFARNTETAASYSNLITFPMLFLSGVFFSIDSAPGWLQGVTRILPLRYLVDGLRDPMTRGDGLGTIWLDFLVLLGTFAAAMIFAVRFFRWESRTA
jgi:ABC-2 type transport system permease protein